jgi:hypothetical protein
MLKEVKIGGTKFNNVFFTETGENYIFAKEYKEDFFGIYNVTVFNESFICKHVKDEYVKVKLEIGNKIYENVVFKLIEEGREGIILNSKTLPKPKAVVSTPLEIVQETVIINDFKDPESSTIDEMIDYKIKRKDLIIEKLQKDIKEIEDKNREDKHFKKEEIKKFFEESIKEGISLYKENVIKDVLSIQQTQENLLEEKLLETSKKVSNILVSEVSKKYENEFFKKFIADATLILNENAEFIIQNNQRLKEDLEEELIKQVNEITAKNIESEEHILKMYEKIDLSTKELIEQKISELKEIEDNYINNINLNVKDLLQQVKKEKQQLTENFESKIEEVITKSVKNAEEINSSILSENTNKIDKLIHDFDNKIQNKLNFIEEKVKNFKGDKFKKDLTSQIIDQTKKYTDTKTQEAIRYARILLDYAGGGGTVAVQYADGGKITGDLVVDGDVTADNLNTGTISLTSANISGDLIVAGNITTYSSFLSGTAERNLLDIFAGEGPGDENDLDGGIF